MIELLLAILLVGAIVVARAYRELRKPSVLDGVNVRRHGRVVGIAARKTFAPRGRLAALVLALGFLLPRSGFTSNGQSVAADVLKVGVTTGAGTTTSLADTNALTEGVNYWRDSIVYVLSGASAGKSATVTASAVGSLALSPPLPNAPGAGAQYLLVNDPTGAVMNKILTLLGQTGLVVDQSGGPNIVDASADALHYFAVYIFDRTSGPISSGNIDLTTTPATIVLAKSHLGAAFSTAGVTQPTLTKANGIVSANVTFKSTEWALGDDWQLQVAGILATDSNGSVEVVREAGWVGKIDTDTTVGGNVATVKTATTKPAADSAANVVMADVLGSKDDASVYAKAATKTALAYLKGLTDVNGAVLGTVTSGASSSSFAASGLGGNASSFFLGWQLVFISGTASNLGIPVFVTSFSTATGALAVSSGSIFSLQATPAANDTFLLIPDMGTKLLLAVGADTTGTDSVAQSVGKKTDTRFYQTAQADLTTRSLINILKGLSSALLAWQSAATGAGAADGSTIVDSGLTSTNYAGQCVVMVSGTAANLGIARVISSVSGTTITVSPGFPAQVANTDKYAILTAEVAKNLQTTNTGTNAVASGAPVENIIIDQATPTGGKVQAFVDLSALTQNATIKLYRKIDGTNYRVMKTYPTFVVGTTDPGFYTDPFFTRNGFKLTITPAVAEGAARSTSWEIFGDPGA